MMQERKKSSNVWQFEEDKAFWRWENKNDEKEYYMKKEEKEKKKEYEKEEKVLMVGSWKVGK